MRLYHKLPFASWLAFPSLVVEPVITLLLEQYLSLSNDPAQLYDSIGGVCDRSLHVGNKTTRGEHCRNMPIMIARQSYAWLLPGGNNVIWLPFIPSFGRSHVRI